MTGGTSLGLRVVRSIFTREFHMLNGWFVLAGICVFSIVAGLVLGRGTSTNPYSRSRTGSSKSSSGDLYVFWDDCSSAPHDHSNV